MLLKTDDHNEQHSSSVSGDFTSLKPLVLEELRDLLLLENSINKKNIPNNSNSDDIVKNALVLFGVSGGTSTSLQTSPPNVWKRCLVPSSLYSTPYLPSQTTLVPLSFVPIPIRKKLGIPSSSYNSDSDDDLVAVEVPISSLLQEAIGGPSHTQHQRQKDHQQPLKLHHPKQDYYLTMGGASKLQEYYTRGGPGTSDNINISNVNLLETSSQYTTPEALKQSLHAILNMSEIEAYNKGFLLTKPPGVSKSYVGLTPQIVYPSLFNGKTIAVIDQVQQINGASSPQITTKITSSTIVNNTSTNSKGGLWDKLFLAEDDDSLFGTSCSSSSSSSTSDGDSSDEEDQEISEKANASPMWETASTITTSSTAATTSRHVVTGATDVKEDIDVLLESLVFDDPFNKAKKKDMDATNSSAAVVTKSPSASSSRSWAITLELDVSDFYTRVVPNPALSFPFELDGFQKQAVARLERNESIFVAAHTSAGKTVCAEYAIALSQKRCTRTIYTSPIKALSNQKFRDFCKKFGTEQIGLITGDAQVNPAAPCLIMTTEILRSMLYRGADLVRDIEFVIFDECHYVNDMERGVVWEEVIIMLPDYVKLVFLSATTPNAIEFCDWIGRTKRKHIYVIRTNYRPVPLTHHLYTPGTGNNNKVMHVIMEGDTKSKTSGFLAKGYSEAVKAMMPAAANNNNNNTKNNKALPGGANSKKPPPKPAFKSGSKQSAWQSQGSRGEWTSFVRFLEREELTPSVVFSFSKKKCEDIALSLRSLDLNTAAERAAVTGFTEQTIKRLNPSDATLPQVICTCEMVKRGISTHHGGLLPILKEMVEILFSRNLIKILFATETFAMGVNMPARSVSFSSIRKHDGLQFRELLPGEYIQMSGRAGRRGLDAVGTVIIICFGEEPPPQAMLSQMLTGTSTKLQSQFRLTYNMILNLLRVEDMSVEDMIKRSFSEFATQRALAANNYPKLLIRGRRALAKLDDEHQFKIRESGIIGAQDIEEYFSLSSQLLRLNFELQSHILVSPGGGGGGALVTGRIVLVTNARRRGYVKAPGIVLQPPSPCSSSTSQLSTSMSGTESSGSSFGKGHQRGGFTPAVCLVLLPYDYRKVGHNDNDNEENLHRRGAKDPVVSDEIGTLNYVGVDSCGRHYAIHEVELTDIFLVSAIKQSVDSKAIFQDASSVQSSSGASRGGQLDPFFGKARTTKREDDAFAGMVPRDKKKGGVTVDTLFSTTSKKGGVFDPSQYHRHVGKIVSLLVEVEAMEASSSLSSISLDVLDLRTITPGVQKGEDYLLYRASCDFMEDLIRQCRSCQSHSHPNVSHHYMLVERKELLRARVNQLERVLSNESLSLFPDFLQRKAVLQALGYVDATTDAVCLKGRIACEVNTCESLIVTELVLDGILNELEPAEIVAVLSALLTQEKKKDGEEEDLINSDLPINLIRCCNRIKSIAYNFGALQKDHGLLIDPGDYADEVLKFGLARVVYEWALGVPFCNICELTDVQEGSIVRCITRLDELCREVRNCARVVGNPTLYIKMEAASAAIKRDIVFASSLYVH